MSIGREEVTWNQLPRERVTLIPKILPTSDRGMEADTMNIRQGIPAREIGPIVGIK
jgi:hypothetical protein